MINLQDVDAKIAKLPVHFRRDLIREQMTNPDFNFALDYREIQAYEDVLDIDRIFIPVNGQTCRDRVIHDTKNNIDIKYDFKCI